MVGKSANVSRIFTDAGRAGFEISLLDHGHLLPLSLFITELWLVVFQGIADPGLDSVRAH
jgi:hypothetical protein